MRIEQANASGSIRVSVAKVNPKSPFAEQEQAVIVAIETARNLLKWYTEQKNDTDNLTPVAS
jgi:hypothetical protein